MEYKFYNAVAGMTFYMKLCDDMDEAIKVNAQTSKFLKNSMIPWGTYCWIYI